MTVEEKRAEIAKKFPTLPKTIIPHSEDLKLIERMKKIVNGIEDEGRRFACDYFFVREITDHNLAPYGKKPEERHDCMAYHFGHYLMNGSFYEKDHSNYTDHNEIFKQIQKEFADVESIKAMCDAFLVENRDDDVYYRIRQIANSLEADWTK